MSTDSRVVHLKTYRDSVHSVVKPCAHCQTPFTTKFGMYCSILCNSRANRAKHKAERLKNLVCFFCGDSVTGRKSKFCSNKHKQLFHTAKKWNKVIKIRIDYKTIIETRKYDSIPKVIRAYKERQTNYK